uniref:Uncharacterized protein n=1 Tax=Haemonchus contortus TaxID=6289 RepID=A0A7I4YSV0_HAECO
MAVVGIAQSGRTFPPNAHAKRRGRHVLCKSPAIPAAAGSGDGGAAASSSAAARAAIDAAATGWPSERSTSSFRWQASMVHVVFIGRRPTTSTTGRPRQSLPPLTLLLAAATWPAAVGDGPALGNYPSTLGNPSS